MKSRISYILVIIGAVGLIGQVLYRVQREKNILEAQMRAQQSSVVEGLKVHWRSFLLEKARQGELKKTYMLRWNRKGSELRDVFFPLKRANMEWKVYRRLRKDGKLSEAKAFLQKALRRSNSWDRILAITEWRNQYGDFSEIESEYERTLVSAEAKTAYRLIFEQFSANRDFTFTSAEIEYDKVFYHVTKDGSIEAFVPSAGEIRETVLPRFLQRYNLASAQLGSDPWELIPPASMQEKIEFSYMDFIWLGLALLSLLGGVAVYFAGLREQKKALLKRVSFLNQVVHELKTPLTGLKLHLQLIRKGRGKEANLQALDISLERLNKLFDDVVLMNRPFERVEPQIIKAQDANLMLADFTKEFFQLKIESEFLIDFYGDEKRLRVILRNLIKNGIRYGREVSVKVDAGKQTVVFVSDRGPGISEGDSKKIFQEFYRSEEAKRVNADGLGLGLYLVRKMAQEMEAVVELANPGKPGAVFKLTLKGAVDE